MVGVVFGLMNITWEMFRRTIIGVVFGLMGLMNMTRKKQDNHKSCICAEEGVDEFKPEELRQRAQIGWQVKITATATDIICGIVMGLLLFVILMLLLLLASSSHECL
jgi:tetrahydromethanopterin S-methyltransferase subunit G